MVVKFFPFQIMAQKNKKTNHDDFRAVVKNLRGQLSVGGSIELSTENALIIVEHGNWFDDYTESRKAARSKVKNPGPARLPDSEIKEGTKAVRAHRERKRAEKLLAEEKKSSPDNVKK